MEALIPAVSIVLMLIITIVYLLKLGEDRDNIKLTEENASLIRRVNRLKQEKENLLITVDTQEVEIVLKEKESDEEKEETRRWNNNYQSMKDKKIKFQKFLIDFEEGDGEKIDQLLKKMLTEGKYLKAKKIRDDKNKQG